MAAPAAADADAQLQRAATERDELTRRARGRLAGDPAVLARFDELYANARCYLAIDEDHNFYIDQMGNAGLRLPFLEMGRRLARYGAIVTPDDVFLLHLDEIGAGMSGVDQRATVGARQADLRRWAAVVPPDTLGVPPSDDVTDPGVASGAARVARSLNEACAAQPGEVLVCEMTLPTWTPLFATVAAVVSDTGGVLSHCAIVARELGIPCVVGTQVGTHTIENGMLLTVDGSRGTVQIQQRPIKPSGRS